MTPTPRPWATVVLRPAVAADLMTVGALHQRSRVATYGHFLPAEALADPTAEAMGHYWTERWRWEQETHRLTVAERDGEIVGFTYVGPDDDGDDSVGLLCAIHLDPAEQGRGTGRELMANALAQLHTAGWASAILWVLRDNTHARRFYERGGWTPDGVERDDQIGPVRARHLRYTRPLP